jgi:hypothetical protein
MTMTGAGERASPGDSEIVLCRPDGVLAELNLPGGPVRPVALRRRETAELLAEELRRLDPDEIYAHVIMGCAAPEKGSS